MTPKNSAQSGQYGPIKFFLNFNIFYFEKKYIDKYRKLKI